jgi:hypothetical protein
MRARNRSCCRRRPRATVVVGRRRLKKCRVLHAAPDGRHAIRLREPTRMRRVTRGRADYVDEELTSSINVVVVFAAAPRVRCWHHRQLLAETLGALRT